MDRSVAIYCRVSTQQQRTDRQKEELLSLAMENGWGVEENHIYMDIMSGFKKGETRPQYSMMLEEVEQGNIGLILFSEFSRLARNATDLLESINYFREKGVYLYFQKQNLWVRDDTKDLGSIILLHILAVMSAYEIELFAERSVSGKITKVLTGQGGGDERAYGYMHDKNKKIVINPDEKDIVVRIFEMYANGRSSIQICEILNAENIPAPYVKRLNQFRKNRMAKGLEEKEYRFDIDNLKWRPSTVNRLMHNELYIGNRKIVFYKPDPSNSTPIKARGNREVIYEYSDTIEDLRIVSDELFQCVQDKLAKAHYNKNNAIKHENLLKHLLTCGECGANFTVGKSALTARNYVSGERTYKCYGRVNRKDKPQTCDNGAQVLQWKLDGLVLQLSIQMFAQINIEQSNILRIENLEKEREELLKVKVVKESEVSVIEDNYRKTIKRLMYLEDDNIVKTMLREEKTKYDKVRDRLEKDLDKLSKEIVSKGVAINNLKRLNSNSVLKSKMNEIRNDKTLVITMINEYVDNIVIYRMHPLWLLVIVSYKGGEEMWGTVKSARYKKDEMFFDEALCQYGIEFQAWLLNNTEHCFSYDRENKIITYNGKSLVYKEFEEGTYNYEAFDKMIKATGWMGAFPFYDYEHANKYLENTKNVNLVQATTNDVNWKEHYDKVLKRLSGKN